jgi:signal peptidase
MARNQFGAIMASDARLTAAALLVTFAIFAPGSAAAEPALFESRRLTPPGEYTSGIEGPAVDAGGTLYVVNLERSGTIGKLPAGAVRSEPFAVLPARSIGNGIRFDRAGRMFVADFNKHNIFVFEPAATVPSVYFHSGDFNQPNDLAIAADGTLYASDPSFRNRTGRIWRIARGADGKGSGAVMSSPRRMGVTNGLDLSPDGATLYVSESNTGEVWAYAIQGAELKAPRLVKKFAGSELDGLRTDLDGRIFATRPGKSVVAVLKPDGTLVREVSLRGKDPTNLTFGGADGKDVFVTQRDGRFIETFRVDRPGREPCLQVPSAC